MTNREAKLKKEIAEMEQDIKQHPIQGRMMSYPLKEMRIELKAITDTNAKWIKQTEESLNEFEKNWDIFVDFGMLSKAEYQLITLKVNFKELKAKLLKEPTA